jgi:hypothetical protein
MTIISAAVDTMKNIPIQKLAKYSKGTIGVGEKIANSAFDKKNQIYGNDLMT